MEVTASTASSFCVDTAVDGSGNSGATPGTSAAGQVSVFFTVPLTMTQTPAPASTVSRHDMDNFQTPMTTKEGAGKSAIPVTPDASSKATPSSESPSIHGPTELVKREIPLVDGTQQRQHPGSDSVSPTEFLVPTEPGSVEASAGAGRINQGTVPAISRALNDTKDSLGSVTPKQHPKKKKKNHHIKQIIVLSEASHGGVATDSPKPNRKGGGSRSTAKQPGAPYDDGAKCVADAELTKVAETPVGSSQDVIALLRESNVLPKELNRHIPAAEEQALSGVVIHSPPSLALQQAQPSYNKRRPKRHSPKASWDRKIPDDEGNVGTRRPKEQVRGTPSHPVVSTLREPQHLGFCLEPGLSRTSDAEQGQASQVQGQDMKKGSLRGQRYAPPFGRIDETANPQTPSTSRTFKKVLGDRSKGPMMQPHCKAKASDNSINNRDGSARNLVSSDTQQSTALGTARNVRIPSSRYKLQRVPIHAKEIPTQDDNQDVHGEPFSHNLTNAPILNSMANKDEVTLPVNATTGKLLAEKEGGNQNVETGKGKPSPSQRNRIKMRYKKEQARAAAGSEAGVSMQFGLAQAQPNYSPQPHITEEPSGLITIHNANIDMNQNPPSVTRQPVSTIGQIQNLLRGMRSDYGKSSRGSSMGRSRGNGYVRRHVNASVEATLTAANPTPSTPSFGHQTVERRQRGYQPNGMPPSVHHDLTGLPQSSAHRDQPGTSKIEVAPTLAVSSPAVQTVTMNATTPEADPVHIEQTLSASRIQSPREAEVKIQPDLNSTPGPTASVRRSAISTTLVASPPAAIPDWNTPRASPEHLDWSRSITPNSFSFNDLPKWTPKPTFLSRERTNSKAQPQSASHKTLEDTVPVITKDVGAQAEIVKKSTLKENESPSIHPKKVESQNIQDSQGRNDQNGAWIPPHLRPPSPPTLLVDVPAYVDAIAILAELEEEDAHLPPHLRRPARKDKALKASPVNFVAAKMPQVLPSEPNGRSGDQTQHNLSAEIKQVVTPLTQDHKEPASTHMTAPALCENPPVESVLPAVLPLRAGRRSKAFGNVKPYRAMWEEEYNAWGNASIDSNVAINDGDTKPRVKLQYEPQLHDWEGKWAPAPVEWDARPSFDNTDSRHMKAMEAWLDQRADSALKEPIKIDTRDPQYLDGGKPAGGLEKLDSPVEDEVFETLLPNDPFTHARIHQTAHGSARAYQKKAYKEKKASKEDRKAYIAATKLHYASYVRPPNPHVPKANIYIRPAGASDMRQVTEIYNHYVKNSVVASERTELTEAQWQVRWRDSTGENFAFLVAVLKNGNRGGRFRRDNAETIVGFAYAEDFSGSDSMYRFTCELQFWVHPQHLRHGIGKTLVDRMLPALDNGYCCRSGTDFVADNPIEYEGGGLRTIARILISIPHDPTDAKDLTWQKQWLSEWGFEQVGNMPGIGRKFEKDIDVAHLMKITSVFIHRAA